VTLLIEPGELFFLLGPSGCGKTTLLRCIAGFCIPDSGAIRIGDADISNLPPHKRDTGMVFQSYALWPHMTVSENVAFGLELRKISADERKRRVADGRWEIDTSIGRIIGAVQPPESVEPGAKVTLSLRPETIRVGRPPAGAANTFDCAIHDTMHLGEVAQHQVTILSANTNWKVFELHPKFVARDEQVERAKAWFDPEDVVILTK
jgi:ABC-type dipeptide/oligopeptide/nickel transport system ATPase component